MHFSNVVAPIRVHANQAADPFLLAFDRVQERLPLTNDAGVDAEIRKASNVRIGDNLENERADRRFVVRRTDDLVFAVDRRRDRVRNIQRRREQFNRRVQQRLNAFILQ